MSSENKLAGSKRNTRKHRRQSTRKKPSGHGYVPRHARCRITTRLTQNNSVTVMQTMRRNPSMQNRTILIQCDRALSRRVNPCSLPLYRRCPLAFLSLQFSISPFLSLCLSVCHVDVSYVFHFDGWWFCNCQLSPTIWRRPTLEIVLNCLTPPPRSNNTILRSFPHALIRTWNSLPCGHPPFYTNSPIFAISSGLKPQPTAIYETRTGSGPHKPIVQHVLSLLFSSLMTKLTFHLLSSLLSFHA